MSNDTYTMLLRGFDVLVEPSEENEAYHVTVSEGGSAGWEVDVPVDLNELTQAGIEDNEDLDGSDALMQYVGNAAVDLFEAQRGTLGEGAAASEVEAMKKRSYCDSLQWEDWYMRLKGTPFEEQATQMLTEYFQLSYQSELVMDAQSDLRQEEYKIFHDMNMLNLERMKALPAGQTVIIIQGSRPKESYWDSFQLEEYLACFMGDLMEPQAISKVRELLDVRDRLSNEDPYDDMWKQVQNLENRMTDLELQALQQNVRVPETGMEAAPNMAGDIAELMQGVDLHAPLDKDGEGSLFNMGELAQQARRHAFEEVAAAVPKRAGLILKIDLYDQIHVPLLVEDRPVTSIEEAQQIVGNAQQMADDLGYWTDLESKNWGHEMGKVYEDGECIGRVSPNGRWVEAKGARRQAFEEVEPVEERIDELGEKREGLDPAEMEGEQFSFNTNEYVELKEDLTVSGPGWGGKTTYPKGTRGFAETQYDKFGDHYLFRTDNGRALIKVKWDQIKTVSRR